MDLRGKRKRGGTFANLSILVIVMVCVCRACGLFVKSKRADRSAVLCTDLLGRIMPSCLAVFVDDGI